MKFTKAFILFLLFTGFSVALFAQTAIKKVVLQTKSPAQFEKAEWSISLLASWQNPYLQEDIAVDMMLQTPSGKKLVLPCYYVEGKSGTESLWKARFLPQEKGKYQYSISVKQNGKEQSTSQQSFTAKASSGNGILHAKDDWTFVFDNGKPFRGIGEDICWESRASDDSKYFGKLHEDTIYNYERMLPLLAAHGGNFFRTWICRWNLPIDWKSGFNNTRYQASDEYYNPSALARLDRLVNLCDSLGLHMMLTLGQGAFMKNEGGFASSSADFFVNPQAKTKYKNRLRYIVARWGYSSSIGAWEFFNEVDNVQFRDRNNPINPNDITQWHDDMSAYLKSVDPYNHLVTTSISHRDIAGLNSLAHIDFNQKHIYKNTKAMPAAIVQYEKNFCKPYVIGEFGYEWDWSKNFDDFADSMDYDFKKGLWYGLFSPTPILPMSWWWEYFDHRGTDAYIKNVRTILDRVTKAGNGSADSVEVSINVDGIEKFSVRCGPEIYVYLNNTKDTLQSINLTIHNSVSFRPEGIEIYNCETGNYVKNNAVLHQRGQMIHADNVAVLPRSDIIVIIKEKR